MPRRSETGVLAVPISKPRYNWSESQLTISPEKAAARFERERALPGAGRSDDGDQRRSTLRYPNVRTVDIIESGRVRAGQIDGETRQANA